MNDRERAFNKDWIGNSKSIYTALGASNHTESERQIHDYYATEPKAMELLLEEEQFSSLIWECACGEGHLSKVLEKHGFEGDIITNPPYKYALEFIKKCFRYCKKRSQGSNVFKITIFRGQKQKTIFS